MVAVLSNLFIALVGTNISQHDYSIVRRILVYGIIQYFIAVKQHLLLVSSLQIGLIFLYSIM